MHRPLAAFVALVLIAPAGSAAASAGRAPRSCGHAHIYRITGFISATGLSCKAAKRVFRAVESARLPPHVAATPYFHWSRKYTVATPAGRFVCRRSPHGLAGSEHTITCSRRSARVRCNTVHD
jgi:hypothetical protein